MKHTEQEIIDLCSEYRIVNYTIKHDGSIDVDGHVYLNNYELTELPLQFNKVSGNFTCSNNKLTSLSGAPKYVGYKFWCQDNPLDESKENLEILSRHKYEMDYYKMYYPNLYNMIIIAKRISNIDNILE